MARPTPRAQAAIRRRSGLACAPAAWMPAWIFYVGRRVTTVGWWVSGKIVTTKDDEPMEFISFEDTSALYETTFFPQTYARFCHMLNRSRPYVLTGLVEEDFGAVTLTVDDVRLI